MANIYKYLTNEEKRESLRGQKDALVDIAFDEFGSPFDKDNYGYALENKLDFPDEIRDLILAANFFCKDQNLTLVNLTNKLKNIPSDEHYKIVGLYVKMQNTEGLAKQCKK